MGLSVLPASVSVGANCVSRNSNRSGGYTVVIVGNSVPVEGIITSWCVYIAQAFAGNHNIRLKVFRIVGSNMNFVGESPIAIVSLGLNTGFPANIPVQPGDLIGYFLDGSSGNSISWTNGATGFLKYEKAGDISSNSLTSSWSYSTGSGPWSIQAQVTTEVIDCSPTRGRGASVSDGISAGKGKRR